ncbi:hypothetical protein llap_5882 [Limosa lapponica baueri]|uniref:Endonuclease/exonuclease/phosphatase domain-containing protein n=1 Tax=Limosa lapponica baueri TaxID=1758121 RepID=A0A2I0UCN1_LIMLA|nr:hypothetical protein llap_5882 [Limosa lapponica baueri]
MKIHLGMDEEPRESLWVKTKCRAGTSDVTVEVCYRPPNQEDQAVDALYKQIGEASRSQALGLMGDFSHPDNCWRNNTAGHKESKEFLERTDDNFLLQVTEEPTRRGSMSDLVLNNKEGLVRNPKLKGSIGCSDHEMVYLQILRAARRVHMLFNIFVSNMESGTECTLSKFADDTKLRDAVGKLEVRDAIQRDQDGLERKDRPSGCGGGVALHVREQLECSELCLAVDEERVESLWVRIKGQANMGDGVCVYYRPPDQEEEVNEASYGQLEIASQSQVLVLMGDFNHPDICWKDNTAQQMQSQRFLQSIDNNFLT